MIVRATHGCMPGRGRNQDRRGWKGEGCLSTTKVPVWRMWRVRGRMRVGTASVCVADRIAGNCDVVVIGVSMPGPWHGRNRHLDACCHTALPQLRVYYPGA